MKLEFKLSNSIRGGAIYTIGDTIAALISDEFSWIRLVGILFIGATIYAFEIPNYFNWIDRKIKIVNGTRLAIARSLLAMLYFNPLWIARHILFVKLFIGNYHEIGWDLIRIGSLSFLINIPISLMANYLIQNKIILKHRFLASAIFSGLMAIYYSLSGTWFSK